MRYIGGKARQARRITEAMLYHRASPRWPTWRYLEPFLGAASVAALMAPHFERADLSDAHPALAPFWRAVADGWTPPAFMPRTAYDALRKGPPTAMQAWAGFAASYNGKWFGGYGPVAEAAGRDYLAEAQRATVAKREGLRRAVIHAEDYRYWAPGPGTLVYCDPPYQDTMGYGGTEPWDAAEFWATMGQWVADGAVVFVSEYSAPEGWTSVLDCDRVATVHHSGSRPARVESLYAPLEMIP